MKLKLNIGRYCSRSSLFVFVRDVLVVIVGIVVTFGTTEFAERRKATSDLRVCLELVRNEMEINKNYILSVRRTVSENQDSYQFARAYIDNLSSLPNDTVSKYLYNTTRWKNVAIQRTALDLLKNNLKIEDVDYLLLIKLTQIYELCFMTKEEWMTYFADNRLMIKYINDNVPFKKILTNEEYFHLIKSCNIFKNRCTDWNITQDVISTIDGAVGGLDDMIGIVDNLLLSGNFAHIEELHAMHKRHLQEELGE